MKIISISIHHGDGSTTKKFLNPIHIISIQRFKSTPHNKSNIICIKMENGEEHNCSFFKLIEINCADDLNQEG